MITDPATPSCPHCGGFVDDVDPVDFGGCCSEVCRQIVEDGKWPSPVGPADHDEMLEWIAEADRLAQPPAPPEES